LTLASFLEVDADEAMAFWARHPHIEYLNVAPNHFTPRNGWFTSEQPDNFLPNLRHLRAHWNDVLLLAPILSQLLSLSIHESINAQIPYLLRSVLPDGLPNLKSLNIGQAPTSSSNIENIEGGLWYETKNGVFFKRTADRAWSNVFDLFMHSIVRATPNLEEIGFHGSNFPLSDFVSTAEPAY